MSMTAAAIRVRTSWAGVILLLLGGFLVASWLLMQPLSAAAPDPGFHAATTAADYKSVVLDLDGPIYATRTLTSGAGVTPETYSVSGDLTFSVGGVAAAATKSATGDDYTLTFSTAVVPHSTVVTVNGGTAYSATGAPIAIDPVPVPFSSADLAAFVSGLQAMPGLPADAADLPFVRGWLDGNDAPLTELVDGLAAVSTTANEADILNALYGLGLPTGGQPGDGVIAAVTFTGRDVDVAFNPDAIGATIDMSGAAGVETIGGAPFEVSLDGVAPVEVGLDGSIALTVTSGAAAVTPGSSDPSVVLTSEVTFAPSGRLGLVDVTAPASVLALDASLPVELACAPAATTCAPSALAAPVVGRVAGTASLTVTTLELLGTAQTFSGSPLLSLQWGDLGDLAAVTAAYDTASVLAGFSTTSVADIAGGLQWVAGWLTELETYANVGAQLPVIGGTAGGLASLSTTLSEPTVAIAELLGLLGDVSAQDLLDLCDPDTIGARVAELDLAAEELQSLLGVDTGDVATLLPQLQASAVEAAGTCAPLLGGIGYDSAANAVTFTVDFEAEHELAEALGGSLDLDLAEEAGLEGISVAVRSGDWSESDATVGFELTFGVKLGTYTQLGIASGVSATDFDGDGELDTVDTDLDGDGLPQSFTFAEGDRCRGLASLFGTSPSALQTHLGITGPTTNPDGTVLATMDALCDAKLVAGTDLLGWRIGGTDDGAVVNALAAADVCAARAARFDLTTADFLARNPSLSAASCGTTTSAGPFSFDDATAMTARAALPHRFYVSAAADVLTADLHIEGTGVGASADLGLLDLDVDVTQLAFDPSLTVALVDPGTSGPKDDGKVDLWELANKADADLLADVVTVDFTGAFSVNVDLHNEALMGDDPRGFDVYGDVADLDGDVEVHTTRLSEAPTADGKVHVGHDLGELVNLKDITPGQALQMLVAVIEQLTAMADSEVLATPLPFIDVTPQDMVDFAGSFADVVARVEARSPEDISALQLALNDALVAVGMPSDLSIGVTANELTLTFDGSRSISRTYPFSLDADDFPDLGPLSFAPSDGGATVTAMAGVTFEPTIGISFDPLLDLEDRIFVRGIAPEFDVSATADVFGSVHLGPAMASVRGSASIGGDGAELAIELLDADGDPLGADAAITLAELGSILSDPADRIGVAFSGPFSADLDVTATIAGIGTIRGNVAVDGDLTDLSATTIETTGFTDFQLKLDLSTFVNGATAAGKFIGRTLEQSEAISGDLPFLGDQLATLASVGTDIRSAAEEIDTLWRSLGEDPDQMETFRSEINGHLQDALCTPLITLGQECEVTIALLTGDPEEPTTEGATLGNAHTFEIGLRLGKNVTEQVALGGGLDLGPFGFDMAIDPQLRFGYGLDVVLGLNLTDGFYIRPGDSMGTDFIQLFAGLSTQVNASADVAGLSAEVTDGSLSIGGTLGPDGQDGGFRVGLVGDTTKLTMRDLTNRRTKIETLVAPGYDLDIQASLPMVVSADGIADLSLPVHISVQGEGQTPPTPRVILGCRTAEDPELCPDGDEDITLDASTIVSQIIKPVLGDLLGDPNINPLGHEAIRTALESDIPILDTKLRNLLRQAAIASGQEAAWSLIEFLIDVGNIDFDCGGITPVPEGGGDCFSGDITLGWAEVVPAFVHHLPDDWGIPDSITNLIASLRRISAAPAGAPTPTTPPPKPTPTPPGTTRPPGVSKASMLSFPILEDPGSALKLVLGKELAEPVTFLEFAPPPVTLGKGINFSQTLFDLDIGFLKGGLKVALQGRLGLTLHLGFGYDSTGVSTGNVLDGFYLVDHEGFEVSLGGSIQGLIDGHFSVFGDVVSVRFRGSAGARLEAGLDLFDESIALPKDSRNNGKLHLWEIGVIADAYPSPFCMFALGAKFDANLSFSGRAKLLGITVFNETWKGNWVLLDERLECTPNPVPAHVDDERRLVLNGGPFADFRFDGRGDVQEHFTLSQSGSTVTVTLVLRNAAGAQLGSTITKTYDASEFDEIHGELGAGPNSVDIADTMTLPATLIGGDQADTLGGGGGDDSLDGAGGANVLTGGPGADVLRGGDGDDTLHGDGGDDDLEGGAGQNTYGFGNAWGTDHIEDAAATATLDFSAVTTPLTGRGFFDEASMTTTDGGVSHEVTYWADEVMLLKGGTAADDVELNRAYPHGFAVDLFGGGDTVTLKFSGINRTISVDDTGASGDDEMIVQGTAADDIFLFRADGPDGPDAAPATDGFVAMGARDHLAGDDEMAADLAAAQAEAAEAGEDFDEETWTDGYLENRARLHLVPDLIDRVDYDSSMEEITTRGEGGDNHFYLDDAAAPLTIDSGDGDNTVQVGQIYRNDRVAPNVALGDEVRTRGSFVATGEAGDHLSYGVSHPTTINGGSGDDQLTVYSNRAHLKLNGGDGDDLFVIRAFVLDGTVEAVGGSGNDKFDYVQNEKVEIDGGGGFNTLMIIGTPFNDGFVLGENGTATDGSPAFGVDICPIAPLAPGETASTADPKQRLPLPDGCAVDVEYQRIQSVVVQALHGNDVFWVRGSDAETHYQLYGGTDGSTFYVQDPEDGVTGVGGPVTIEGEFDPTFDVSLRKPVVLPGEDDEQAMGTQQVDYDRQDSWLIVDAGSHTGDDVGRLTECEGFSACRTDSSRVVGLGMGDSASGPRDAIPVRIGTERDELGAETPVMRDYPSGLVYHSIDEVTVELGSGDDDFTVESTHTSVNLEELETISETTVVGGAGDDDLQVDTIDGPTWVHLGEGDDHARIGVGTDTGDLTGIADELEITGGAGTDDVVVDGTIGAASADGLRADLDLVREGDVPTWAELTQLEMPGLVRHDAAVELLQVLTGDGDDVANVRGSLAGLTELLGGDGEDRTFVTSAASLDVDDATPGILGGHLDDIVGAVHDDAGDDDNLLMVSDRDSGTPRTATADEGSFAVEGLGAVTYDATGTYAKGVSVWLSTGVDTIDVTGARRDETATPTLLAWEAADPSDTPEARTLTTMNTGGGADQLTVALPAGDGLLVVNLEAGDDRLLGASSLSGFAAFGGAGADRIQSGAGDDLVFGDFGRVEYRSAGALVEVLGVPDRMDLVAGRATAPSLVGTCNVQPSVSAAGVVGCTGADGGTGGRITHTGTGAPTAEVRNWISVGDGDDVAFGGREADWIEASGGRNALVGDHGEVKRVLPSELGGRRPITSSDGSIEQTVLEEPFAYVVDVHDTRGGAPDVILGGSARDWVFAGQGDDVVNAGSGGDLVFGGYGLDALWGGLGDDRIYGGWGDDLVDLKLVNPPTGKKATPTTDGWPIGSWWTGAPIVRSSGWAVLAPTEDTDKLPATANGSDLVYGGEGPDAMQADVGGAGPVPGDRLIDWHGAYNVYFVCDGAYGAGRVVRLSSPSIVAKLGELALADGAFGANGARQIAIPTSGNAKPTHPAHPGNNFDCTAP